MQVRDRSWLLAAVSAALLAGCGAARPRATPSGRAVFSAACSACHTLSGVNDPRHQGGDLRHFHSSRTQLFELTGEMPVRRALTASQLRAVVGYVMAVERRPDRGLTACHHRLHRALIPCWNTQGWWFHARARARPALRRTWPSPC